MANDIDDTVARLNRLLYASTSPEKYATFFFGLYNEETRQFNYTNAGHLPPLHIHRNGYRLLEVTGSVVGGLSTSSGRAGTTIQSLRSISAANCLLSQPA